MSLARLMNQPLTIQKMGGSALDEYGNASPAALGAPLSAVGYLEQSQSIETLNDRDTVVSMWVAYLPAGSNIGPFDRINFNGQKFEVKGEPWQVYNPRTQAVSHLQMELTVVK